MPFPQFHTVADGYPLLMPYDTPSSIPPHPAVAAAGGGSTTGGMSAGRTYPLDTSQTSASHLPIEFIDLIGTGISSASNTTNHIGHHQQLVSMSSGPVIEIERPGTPLGENIHTAYKAVIQFCVCPKPHLTSFDASSLVHVASR